MLELDKTEMFYIFIARTICCAMIIRAVPATSERSERGLVWVPLCASEGKAAARGDGSTGICRDPVPPQRVLPAAVLLCCASERRGQPGCQQKPRAPGESVLSAISGIYSKRLQWVKLSQGHLHPEHTCLIVFIIY